MSNKFNILTNQNADSTYRLLINGELDDVLAFYLSTSQMRDAIDAVHQVLQYDPKARPTLLFSYMATYLLTVDAQ